ncbi:hypothetical protein LIER_14254 [Lithospermum erythrorhizon]|uniref:Uncharacterized protein n=1 Tax=Lithospermum erythrorhizon TaxID=34254 RepID=A0AAV3PYX6_LITER
MAYPRADLLRGSAFSRLQGDLRKWKEVKEGRIEYLTSLKTSSGNVFLKIENKQLLPRPPRDSKLQSGSDASGHWVLSRHPIFLCVSQAGDEPGVDQASGHTTGRVPRRCSEPTGGPEPHGHNGEASATGHEDSGIHYRGYGGRSLQQNHRPACIIAIRGGGIPYTSQDEVPSIPWDGRDTGELEKARGCNLASTKQIKAQVEVDYTSQRPEGSKDRNVCTLEVLEEGPKRRRGHEEIRSILFDERDT